MGGGGSAPPPAPDPNVVAEQNRQKGIALAQIYAQQSSAFGAGATSNKSMAFALDPSMFTLDPNSTVTPPIPDVQDAAMPYQPGVNGYMPAQGNDAPEPVPLTPDQMAANDSYREYLGKKYSESAAYSNEYTDKKVQLFNYLQYVAANRKVVK